MSRIIPSTAHPSSTLPFALVLACVACGPPEPKTAANPSGESVPANSVSEERLKGNEQPGAPKPADKPGDPTQAVVTPMGKPNALPPEDPKAPTKSGAKVSPEECDRIYDKAMQLEIATNPALAGAGPEVIAMAKQMAQQKHGSAPCDATRSQYTCAMGATNVSKLKQCLK